MCVSLFCINLMSIHLHFAGEGPPNTIVLGFFRRSGKYDTGFLHSARLLSMIDMVPTRLGIEDVCCILRVPL